jgi:dienelactone hydrolase
MRRATTTVLFGLVILTLTAGAQTKPPATFADYGQWESLAQAGAYGGFSPDGAWVAYAINRSSRNNELRVTKLADKTTKTVAFGAQPAWSSDSKWLAYSIGVSEADQEKLRADQKPVRNKLGVLNAGSGETTTIDEIESFAFSGDGAYLAMRRYSPDRPSGSSGAGAGGGRGGRAAAPSPDEEPPAASTLVVRTMATGQDASFGNVSAFAWQDGARTHLLALAISAEGKTGNGVQLYDPATTTLRVLDSSPAVYTGLTWRKDSADLAALRAKADDRREGSTHVVLAWMGLGKAERQRAFDPTADPKFPAGMRAVTFRRLAWSDDGKRLFLGIAPWEEKPTPVEKGDKADAPKETRGGGAAADEASTVEVWHWKDVSVMPLQKTRAAQDRRRSLLVAWYPDSGRFVQLGKDLVNEQVTPIRKSNFAWVAEWSKYAMERTIGRPAADLYLQDMVTGVREKQRDQVNDRYVQTSPGGKFLLFLQDDHYWAIDLSTREAANLTLKVPTSFINKESDETVKQKPPFGVAGWTRDDEAVLLYDKFDVWQVPTDGSKAQRLTDGAAAQVRARLVRLDPEEESINPDRPIYVSLYGDRTKKYGYGRLRPGGGVDSLVFVDKNVSGLAKARTEEVYGYVVQNHDDSPDLFVGDADLKAAAQVTATNPFQSNFAWSRSELVDYKTDKGRPLQGALYYPAGYEPGKKYPMIVYMYELLSQNVHRYVAPSDRDYYNTSVFTSLGYFVFQPDIVFTPRQPGVSVAECVTAGVKKVVAMGAVDAKRVGAIGHSMGGFDASFLATHTTGVFAAAVAGAPITDLVSYYGDHHWSSGIAETDHIETGQERMEVALYEDFKAYVDNSAVFNVQNMTVPLLLEAGDVDGTVAWHQSIELYNIARRAKKNVVMVAYIGEDHGLRQKKNQQDYQRRIIAWFGHYLKGEPPERWITDGQSFLDREAEVKRPAGKK